MPLAEVHVATPTAATSAEPPPFAHVLLKLVAQHDYIQLPPLDLNELRSNLHRAPTQSPNSLPRRWLEYNLELPRDRDRKIYQSNEAVEEAAHLGLPSQRLSRRRWRNEARWTSEALEKRPRAMANMTGVNANITAEKATKERKERKALLLAA